MPSFIELDGGYPYSTYACAVALSISNAGLTDVLAIGGNNSSYVLVQKIEITSNAPSTIGVTIYKRTTLSTATITIPLPICQNSSLDPAPVATANFFETVATVGTGVALESFYINTPPGDNYRVFDYGPYECSESITLQNANESMCINLEGAFPTGDVIRIKIRWVEIPHSP